MASNGTNFISDYYGGCAIDSVGNIYAADQYHGNVNVQTTNFVVLDTFTSVSQNGGAALVKHDPTGHVMWAAGMTNNDPNSFSFADCTAIAPGNGAYLAANCAGTNWLGTNMFTNTGNYSVLLARFDSGGSNLWARQIGQSNMVLNGYNDLVSDASGDVTAAGYFLGTVDFGGTNLSAPSLVTGFAARYDSNGVLQWAQAFPGYNSHIAEGNGLIYVAMSGQVAS